MTKIFSIDDKVFQLVGQPNEAGCRGCCFDTEKGCDMPVELAVQAGTICGEEEMIYKDITGE